MRRANALLDFVFEWVSKCIRIYLFLFRFFFSFNVFQHVDALFLHGIFAFVSETDDDIIYQTHAKYKTTFSYFCVFWSSEFIMRSRLVQQQQNKMNNFTLELKSFDGSQIHIQLRHVWWTTLFIVGSYNWNWHSRIEKKKTNVISANKQHEKIAHDLVDQRRTTNAIFATLCYPIAGRPIFHLVLFFCFCCCLALWTENFNLIWCLLACDVCASLELCRDASLQYAACVTT